MTPSEYEEESRDSFPASPHAALSINEADLAAPDGIAAEAVHEADNESASPSSQHLLKRQLSRNARRKFSTSADDETPHAPFAPSSITAAAAAATVAATATASGDANPKTAVEWNEEDSDLMLDENGDPSRCAIRSHFSKQVVALAHARPYHIFPAFDMSRFLQCLCDAARARVLDDRADDERPAPQVCASDVSDVSIIAPTIANCATDHSFLSTFTELG